jgi:integrase
MERLSRSPAFHVTITILRHALGTQMRLNGADFLDIKMQMRHKNIQSTMKYVNTANKVLLKERVDRYVPEF